MREWIIESTIVGTICDAKSVKQLKHKKTLPGKTVKRFGDNVSVDGVNASGFVSVICLMLAFKKIPFKEMRKLLKDTSLFNKKTLPSLLYISVNREVCVLSSGVCLD